MIKRFVVLLDSAAEDQDNQFLEWLKEKGVGWWHWLSLSWLIVNSRGDLSAGKIRNKVTEVYGSNTLVIELQGSDDTWAGYGPKRGKRNMFKWLEETWSKLD